MAAYKFFSSLSKNAYFRMFSSSAKEIKKIAVIGSGLMGSGIAQVSYNIGEILIPSRILLNMRFVSEYRMD
jgi:hypothetical protein